MPYDSKAGSNMCWFSRWDTVFSYSNVSSCMFLSHVVSQWLETGFEALCPTFEERSWRVGIDRPNMFLFLMTYVLNSFSLYMLYRSNSHSHLKRLPCVAFRHGAHCPAASWPFHLIQGCLDVCHYHRHQSIHHLRRMSFGSVESSG